MLASWEVMVKYIVCTKRKGKPRVPVAICEKCRKKCGEYKKTIESNPNKQKKGIANLEPQI